ncbi:MAG: hypothetical protein AAF270_06055 [Pseudomonadota bacterium]
MKIKYRFLGAFGLVLVGLIGGALLTKQSPDSTSQPDVARLGNSSSNQQQDSAEDEASLVPVAPVNARPVTRDEPNVFSPQSSFGEAVIFSVADQCDDKGQQCMPLPLPQHEYARYSNDELKIIAEYDGAAAIILAARIAPESFEEAAPWAVRGFLLTGDPFAYRMVMQLQSVELGQTYAEGRFDSAAAEHAYVWLKMGHLLGVTEAGELQRQTSVLQQHGISDISHLDIAARDGADGMQQQRVKLTGSAFE